MAMDLLKRLASSPLPADLRSPEDIDKVRLLRAAGLVLASLPADRDAKGGLALQQTGQVLAITPKGCEALEEVGYPTGQLGAVAPQGVLTRRLLDAIGRARERR